jgi:mono/diheme cytochrome c family protein
MADGLLGASNLESLLEELWKCDPVCVECHMKRGRERKRPNQGSLPLDIQEWIRAGIPEAIDGEQEQLL